MIFNERLHGQKGNTIETASNFISSEEKARSRLSQLLLAGRICDPNVPVRLKDRDAAASQWHARTHTHGTAPQDCRAQTEQYCTARY
jgi:hypothetical protein